MANSHVHPFRRFLRMLNIERSDLWTLMVFTAIIGLMNLAVPLGTQALVQSIASGMLRQPLVVISVLVAGALLFASALQVVQIKIIEQIQQRVFAQSALKVSATLIGVRLDALRDEYPPELVNRFFDVLTIQKALSKLLADGYANLLQAIVGMIVLAFYSPYLVILDAFFLFLIVVMTLGLGINGLRTSTKESKEKYAVASWMEDLARCLTSLKMHGNQTWLRKKADARVADYIRARKDHFRVVMRQAIGLQIIEAIAQPLVLVVGGWLVLDGQITLGQLVASQIVVSGVLKASEKLVLQADQFFDLLTGLEKVGHLTDLPEEREGGTAMPERVDVRGAALEINGIRFQYRQGVDILKNVTLELQPGDRASLVGASGAGKSTLASLICGLEEPCQGTIMVDNREVRRVDLTSLRRDIAYVGSDNELFDGTIEENILVGRDWVTYEDLRWALDEACLTDEIAKMASGLAEPIVSGGKNLSRGQIQRILLARAIVGRPRLLILDEAFTGIDERQTMSILNNLFEKENGWTILDISHMSEVVARTDMIFVLCDGVIVESGTPEVLGQQADGAFASLFPHLSALIQAGNLKFFRPVTN